MSTSSTTNKAPTLRDAYRDWLKIPEDQQPPDHYAVLGLKRFEGEAGKVQEATMARMKVVRPRCLKYHELGTQLLNQIAAANICLTDVAAKAEYDKTLRSGGVTAAVQLAGKSGTQERARLHELLDEARKQRQAAQPPGGVKPKAPPKPKPESFELTAADMLDSADETYDLTLEDIDDDLIDNEIERLLAEYDLAGERTPRRPAPQAVPAHGESPFAAQGGSPSAVQGGSPFATHVSDDDDDDADGVIMDSGNTLSDQAQAILVALGLGVAAVFIIGGLIVFAVSNSSTTTAAKPLAPPPPPVPSGQTPISSTTSVPATTVESAPTPGGSPGPSAPAPGSPADLARLERFTGLLTRVEHRTDRVIVIMQATSSEFAEGGGADQPISSPTMIGAVVTHPGFAEQILDYHSLEEAVDEMLATGKTVELLTAQGTDAGVAEASDTVIMTGRRTTNVPATLMPEGGWVVELTAIEKANNQATRVEIGQPRDYFSDAVHDNRTPLHRLLRGFGTSRSGSVTLAGTTVEPGAGGTLVFQPALSTRLVLLDMTESDLPSDQRTLLGTGRPVEVNVNTYGRFDDAGNPILEVRGVQAIAADSVAMAPEPGQGGPGGLPGDPAGGGDAPGEVPADDAAGAPGGPGLPGVGGPGSPDFAQGPAAGRAPVDTSTGEKFYIIRVYNQASKSNSYEVVYGREGKKQRIEEYRLYETPGYGRQGLRASAEVGEFKTEELANARVQVLQAKEARRRVTGRGFP